MTRLLNQRTSYVIVITRGRNTVSTQNNRPSTNQGKALSFGAKCAMIAITKQITAKHNNNVIMGLSFFQFSGLLFCYQSLYFQIGMTFAARSNHPSTQTRTILAVLSPPD